MFLTYQLINKKLIISLVLVVILCVWIPLVSDASSTISYSLTPISLTNKANTSNNTTTATPIEHLIIIFQENVSFDHYFGSYPHAENLDGEIPFYASANTPSIDGLTKSLLYNNMNLNDPFRMSKDDAKTIASCDNNHTYTAIQKSYNRGIMNKFVESNGIVREGCDPGQVMGYFDGNPITALWNYVQHFAINDNFHSTITSPSLPGHINLISGQTYGAIPANIENEVSNGTLIGDIDTLFDDCSNGTKIYMTGKNIGDLLNNKEITWGWFSGGFKPTQDQTSILRFIEDNWNLGRIGDNSFDEKAGSIFNMFNFTKGHYAEKLFLNSNNGTIVNKNSK